MAMKPKVTLDAREFNSMVRELSRLSGADYREVIRAEGSAILSKAASGTKATSTKQINQRHKPVYEGGGREFAQYNQKVYFLKNKLPDAAFQAITQRLKAKVKYLKSVRGLARATWFAIGRQVGIAVKVAAFVSKPKPVNLDRFTEGKEEKSGAKYTLTFRNDSKMIPHAGMAFALRRAIMGRVNYFKTNLRKGVFNDLKARTSKYKGIRWR